MAEHVPMNYYEDVLITVREAAKRLGIREGTVRAWLAQRRLPRVRCGRAVRIPAAAVEDFIKRHTVSAKETQS